MLFETAPVIGEVGGWESPIAPGRSRGTGFTDQGAALVTGGFEEGSYVTASPLDGSGPTIVAGGPQPAFPLADMNANGTVVYYPEPDGVWAARLTDTDGLLYTAPSGWSIDGVSWDGSTVAIAAQPGAEEAPTDACGPTRLVSSAVGAVIAELSGTGCPGPVYFSPDGRLVYTTFDDLAWGGLFDTTTGDLIVDFPS